MRKVLVPLDIAIELKKIGFNEPCFVNYHLDLCMSLKYKIQDNCFRISDVETFRNGEEGKGGEVAIPTWEQVFDWFRSKNYEVCIDYVVGNTCTIYKVNVNASGEELEFDTERFYTYEEAREFVVKEIIKEYEYEN